jgi:hypothetical protein
MKLKIIMLLVILSVMNCGKSFSGVYNCIGGGLKNKQLEFRSGKNIMINGMSAGTYSYEDGYIYVKSNGGSGISFKVQEDNTLLSEGFFKGSTCTQAK